MCRVMNILGNTFVAGSRGAPGTQETPWGSWGTLGAPGDPDPSLAASQEA